MKRFFDSEWNLCDESVAVYWRESFTDADGIINKYKTGIVRRENSALARPVVDAHGDLPGHEVKVSDRAIPSVGAALLSEG